MLAIEKAITEGTPAEAPIVLGWYINTCLPLMSLPHDKHSAWRDDITHMLQAAGNKHRIQHEELETLLGRLQHTASILTEGNHFLNRIRTAEMLSLIHI